MEYLLDVHTHTLASGHGYSTIREMAYEASQKGLKLLGITEHAPKMPGTCMEFYFYNLKVVKREMCGVELLLGTELNIMDYDGSVDLPESILKTLDLGIASMHPPCIKPGTKEQNTNAYLRAMENPYVNIIGHPDDGRYPVDYKALVLGAKNNHVLLEFNNGSLMPNGARTSAWEQDKEMLAYCAEYDVPIVVNSDAHVDYLIGDFALAKERLAEIHFPEHLIVNRSVEVFKSYLTK